MVRICVKQAISRSLDEVILAKLCNEPSDDSDNFSIDSDDCCTCDIDDEAELMLHSTKCSKQRYVAEHFCVPKSKAFVDKLSSRLDDSRFIQEYHMSKSSFECIYQMIKDLIYRATGRQQMNPRLQLLLTLHQLGIYGNTASIEFVARKFCVSEGIIANCTWHVIKPYVNIRLEKFHGGETSSKLSLKSNCKLKS